ncbi:MAG: M24 family metallopeptidase [bacterium]
MRTKEEISAHKKSVHVLENIFDNIEMLIANNPNITEYDIQKHIESDFEKYNHSTDKDRPIVAYRENSSVVHYYPQKQ